MNKRTSKETVLDFNKKYGDYLIGKEGEYKCSKCKNNWLPTDNDVNTKALHCYYRCCGACRLYLYNCQIAKRERKLNVCL